MNTKPLLIIILLFFLTGCASRYTPGISYENMSPDYIRNIRCNWAEYPLVKYSLHPGQGASQAFWIKNRKDFFGDVTIQWENAEGTQFIEKISVNPDSYPLLKKSFDDLSGFYFYFTQEGVDYFVRERQVYTEDITERVRLMEKYRIQHAREKDQQKKAN